MMAAPDAETRELTEMEKSTSRIVLMTWNPGGGCKHISNVIDESGYHVVVCQEASGCYSDLAKDRWSQVMQYEQFVAARAPARVEPLCGECPKKRCRWLLAKIRFGVPRCELASLSVLSIHLNNVIAKKAVAPLDALEHVFTTASTHGALDVVCGDINMARWGAEKGGHWRPEVLELLLRWGIAPISDYANECCFIGVHTSLTSRFKVAGSSWGEQVQNGGDEGWDRFATQIGCKLTSNDVHWPLTLSIRMKESASGKRKRSQGAVKARLAKRGKQQKLSAISSLKQTAAKFVPKRRR